MLLVSYLLPYFQKAQIHNLPFKHYFPQKGAGNASLMAPRGSCVTAKQRRNLRAGMKDVSEMPGHPEEQKAPYLGGYFTSITTPGGLGSEDREENLCFLINKAIDTNLTNNGSCKVPVPQAHTIPCLSRGRGSRSPRPSQTPFPGLSLAAKGTQQFQSHLKPPQEARLLAGFASKPLFSLQRVIVRG